MTSLEQFIAILEEYTSAPEQNRGVCDSNKPDGIFYSVEEHQEFTQYLETITKLIKKRG